MERNITSLNYRIMKRAFLGVAVGTLLWMYPAYPGVSFVEPPKEGPAEPGENYPESRFGSPPMRVETGVSSDYAARAVMDMEAPDEEIRTSRPLGRPLGRGLASAPETAPAATTATAPLVGDEKVEPASVIARKGVQEVALIAGELGFFPKTVFVSRDVPVRMFVTGASKNPLCFMMDSFQVRRQVRSQKIEEITFTPSTPGQYRFYCPVNGMEGTLVVKEFASN